MKKVFFAALGAAIVFASSCKKDSQDSFGSVQKELVTGAIVDTLKGNITVNTTVTKTTYLKGIVFVKPGVTLTVNAGVTIKGSNGPTGVDSTQLQNAKGTLIVERGAKLIANGTASSPIIWTSEQTSGSKDFGDWGGIVINGNSHVVTALGASTNINEAFAGFVQNTGNRFTYGNATPNSVDNSGSITYNRIEFAGGTVTAANREVNGLTLCGVGSGTTINHVEVSNSGDDAFEFFGGSVNVNYLLSFGNKDDDYDFDEGYNGRLQFIIAYRTDLADNSGSQIIELDNNSTSTIHAGRPRTLPFIANATFIGPSSLTPRAFNLAGAPIASSFFANTIFVRRSGLLRFLNSVVSPGALPNLFTTTPTTNASFLLAPTAPDASAVLNNLFEPGVASQKVRLASNEGNPSITTYNSALETQFSSYNTSFLANYAAFKLGAALQPIAGSPALSGGFNLGAYGFVATTQRGAVRTTDIWTAGSWISTAIH